MTDLAPTPHAADVDTIHRALRDLIADGQRIPVDAYSSLHIIMNSTNADEFFVRLAAMERIGDVERSTDSIGATARLRVGTVLVQITLGARLMPKRMELVEVPAWPDTPTTP